MRLSDWALFNAGRQILKSYIFIHDSQNLEPRLLYVLVDRSQGRHYIDKYHIRSREVNTE